MWLCVGSLGCVCRGQNKGMWKCPHAIIIQYFQEGQGQGSSTQALSFLNVVRHRNCHGCPCICTLAGQCCLSAKKQPCLEPEI